MPPKKAPAKTGKDKPTKPKAGAGGKAKKKVRFGFLIAFSKFIERVVSVDRQQSIALVLEVPRRNF